MTKFTRLSVKTFFLTLATGVMILFSNDSKAQIPNCSVTVPTFNVDFAGNPGGSFVTTPVTRAGNCCGTTSPDRCIHFVINIDSNTVAVSFEIASGAIPPGALFYQIDCGPQTQVGQAVCISGAGIHHMTFCKPGNNVNTYRVISIPRPIFPFDDTLRVGCSQNISVIGLVENTVTFNSIFPGAPGAYNSFLSCSTGCSSPLFTPTTGAPTYVEYQICGFPQASGCGYNVTVCDTVRMYIYPELEATVSPNPASFCPAAPGVLLTSTVTGGYGAYSYEWKNSGGTTIATTPDYFATGPDNYTLNVSDGLVPTCPVEVTPVPVNVANVVPATSQTNVACNGDSTGTAIVTATGGTLPYTYSWNTTPVQTNDTAINLPAGSYTVTVTDAGGCAQPIGVTITEPPAIVFSLDSANDVTCNGNANGSIYISASGGTGTLSYLWTPGGYTTQDVTGLTPGVYSVTITDSNGCTEVITDTITEPSTVTPLPGLPVSSTDALCFGDSTGTASINVILLGGTPPYSYDWSTGDTTSSISGLPAGVITLLITDDNGCTADTTLTIGEPTPLTSSFPNFSSYFCGYGVSCNGASDGSIDYDVIGGTPTYTFSWAPGGFITEDLSGIPAGFYTVDVTDANGCMITDTITISEPDVLVADVWSPVNAGGYNIACHGDSSGVIHTILAGGCSPMTFDWTTPLGLPPDSGLQFLPVGFYSLTVTDANGCVVVDTITLTEPDTLVPRITSIDLNGVNISCFGGNDGTAYLESISGGSAPFTYYWSTGDSTDTLSNIVVGSYTLIVIDTNGCMNHASITLTQPDILNSQYTTSHYPSPSDPIQYEISCNGLSDGFISVDTVLGGVGPFTFSWDVLPDITPNVSGLPAGTYNYTITDANDCELTVPVNLTEPDAIDVSASIPPYNGYEIDCNGSSNGAIDLTVLGGTVNIDYSYAWSPNTADVGPSVSNLAAGTYCVHIEDDNGCAVDTCFTLTEPTQLIIDSVSSPEYPGGWNVSCNGGTDGNIYSWSSGGVGPFTYYWSNGDTTANTLNVSVFTYYLTVTDANGCTATDSITIDEPALVATTIDVQVNVACFGDTSGSITVSTTGGTPGYTYSTDGITFTSSPTLTGFTSGSYVLYTADTNGCMDSIAFTITEPTAALSSQLDTSTNVDCFGNASGQATISGIDGTPPYEYAIDGVTFQASGTFTNLTVGSYQVTVRDSNGCTTIEYFNITQPTGALAVSVASQSDVDCFGNSTGQITATGSLGTAPYQYSIDGVTFSPDSVFPGLIAGNYTITIQDTNGCQSTVNVSIGEPASPLTATHSTTMALCTGSPDGTATVFPSGGTPGYTYVWSTIPVQTTQTATGIIAGTYSVMITDTNGCTYNDTGIVVTEAVVLSGSTSTTMALCFGDSTGSASATPLGGTPGYTYSWNTVPVQNTQTATGLPAGNYIVTITDTNGCNVPINATVSEPTQLTSTMTFTDVLCTGDTTGTATVTPAGGTPGYAYSWNTIPIQTTSTATGLGQGSFVVTITDTNGCVLTDTVDINQPAALGAAPSQSNVNCFGDSTGMASVSVSGGIVPYTYSWNSNPVQFTDTAFNLPAGTYTVTVTDSNNCTTTATVTITEPSAALTATSSTTDVLCNGDSTGTATVTASGGTPGYSYVWSSNPVQTTATATGLPAGTYTCVITDTLNCTYTAVNVTVNEPPVLTATSSTTDVLCNGDSTGSATVNPSGGVPGYTYSWSTIPVQTTQTAIDLPQGSYTCTITDTNNCTFQVNVTINEPTALTNAVVVSTYGSYNIQCNGGTNGYIVLNESGGTPNYTYVWTGTTATGDSAGGLTAGPYSVIITDLNGCMDTVNVTLTEPTPLSATTSFVDANCNGNTTGSASAAASGGVGPYTYLWTPGGSTNDTITGLLAGTYSCTITDSNNCTTTVSVTISQPPTLAVNVTGSGSVTCNAGADGIAVANVTGGTANYTFLWSPGGGTNDTLSNLTAGTYTVTVTDANSCTGTGSITIAEPPALTTSASGPTAVCGGSASLTGVLQGNQSGLWTSSDPGVTFSNSTGANTQADNMQFGTSTMFTWTVTDNITQCTATATVQVQADEPVTAEIDPEDTVFCVNSPDYDGHFHVNAEQTNAGTGTWSVASGTGTIDDPTATSIHYETATAGTSVLVWTVVNGVCAADDSVTLQLNNDGPCLELELPTGFTPNSDTYNDDYDIHGIENYPNNTFIVFNRWGNEVYKKENYRNHDWKGDNKNGKPLPDGTYYVILLIHDAEKTTRNTYVDIRR